MLLDLELKGEFCGICVPSSGVNFDFKDLEGRVQNPRHPWFNSSEYLIIESSYY